MFNKNCLALAVCVAAWSQAPKPGTVTGSVLDSQTGHPISGVSIAIDGVSSDRNVTGTNGTFTITAPVGQRTLRFSSPNYQPVDVTDVIVKSGETTELSTLLSNIANVTKIDVVERVGALEATAEAMLNERKLSSTVSDSMSREELGGSTSSDAAGALQKVTGVSVVGGGFVYVRGLGERYSATQLNGAMIPTTEPEKRVVPLDMFPVGMIENIRITKSYSADLPAEFSGGMVQMKTIEFPTQKMLNFSMKTGFNTVTTFNNSLSFPGGGVDYFGFGAGSKGIPASIPANQRLIPGQFTQQQLQDFGKTFSNNWVPNIVGSTRPNMDWSGVGGGTWGRFGLVGSLSFTNKSQNQIEIQRYLRQGAGSPIVFTNYPDFREYAEIARVGAVLNLAVRLTPQNKIIFRNTFTHDSEKTAREFSGYDGGVDGFLNSQRLRYVERGLFSTGVEGDHAFSKFHSSLLHWQMTYSDSNRAEPDLREVFRNLLPDGRYVFAATGSSGVRFFSDLRDKIYEPQADFSVPFFKGVVSGLFKTGVRATIRKRDFSARRFLYAPQQFTTLNLFQSSNELFGAANIRPNGFQITEFTRATDTYTAEMDLYAGFAMVDLSLGSRWRIETGLRIEDADQRVVTYDNRIPNAKPVNAGLHNRDAAPAVNVIYSLTKRQNLRFSYSRTLSRPDFRELSPFDFNNVLGGFVVAGNPNLVRATIRNYDARWELFPGGNQVLAASFFAKKFTDPIEQTIVPSNDLRQTFVNAKGASNMGFELEARQNLGQFHKSLNALSVNGNFTFVDSNIDIKPEDATIVTSKSRPLLGQSRFIYNASVQWRKAKWRSDARFNANYVSRRIASVGTFLLPDIYQEANTYLDFVYQYVIGEKSKWALRFEAENLADNKYRWTQANIIQRDYQLGRTFQVGLSFSLF